jgi:hypothetical protein
MKQGYGMDGWDVEGGLDVFGGAICGIFFWGGGMAFLLVLLQNAA